MTKSFIIICLVLTSANSQTPQHKSMVRIPGATFQMGTDAAKVPQIAAAFNIGKYPDLIQAETPQHTVTLTSFYLDKYEVTNAEFREFIRKHPEWSAAHIEPRFHNGNYLKDWTGDNFPNGKVSHPVVNVSWYAAVAYCQSLGKRLPTEAEWEFAARGGLIDKTFPWGNAPADKTRANFSGSGIGSTTPVGAYPANGYGLFDMAGNVWEFMADEWASYSTQPHSAQPQTNPIAGGDLFQQGQSFRDVTTRRVIRGGSFGGAPVNLRVTYRDSHPTDGAREFVGFRCAASP